jgi:transposase
MAQMVVTAGIDVSKGWLNIALWPHNAELQVDRAAAGYDQLTAWLTQHGVMRVGLEASGGYEIAVIDALEARGFEVVRFNAQRVRLFARAKGRLAKNDRADARAIAQATAVLLDGAPARRRRDLDPLVEHLTYRRQMRVWITDCASQLEHLRDRSLRKKTEQRQIALRQELAALDRTLAKLVAEHDDWHVLEQRLRSVPGVGPVLVHTLIPCCPSSADCRGGPSPAWSASHPSMMIAANMPVSAISEAAAPPSARCCTWPPWSPNGTTR